MLSACSALLFEWMWVCVSVRVYLAMWSVETRHSAICVCLCTVGWIDGGYQVSVEFVVSLQNTQYEYIINVVFIASYMLVAIHSTIQNTSTRYECELRAIAKQSRNRMISNNREYSDKNIHILFAFWLLFGFVGVSNASVRETHTAKRVCLLGHHHIHTQHTWNTIN